MRGDDRSLTHDNQQQGELEAVLPFHLCSTPALTMSQLSPLVCLINKQLVMFSPHGHLNDHHFATFKRSPTIFSFEPPFFAWATFCSRNLFLSTFKYSAFGGRWVAEILSLMLARPLFLSSREIKISRFHWCLICWHWSNTTIICLLMLLSLLLLLLLLQSGEAALGVFALRLVTTEPTAAWTKKRSPFPPSCVTQAPLCRVRLAASNCGRVLVRPRTRRTASEEARPAPQTRSTSTDYSDN